MTKNRSKWLLFFVFTCLTLHSDAQFPKLLKFDVIDNTKGLPNNFINDIEIDSLGFLWIATNDGLCRYDSPTKIKIYQSGEIGLESSHIKAIHAGDNYNLWIGTNFGGVTKYNILDNTVRTYNNSENDKYKLSNNEVLCVEEMNAKEVWIGTEYGLNVLYHEMDSIYQFPIDTGQQTYIQTKAILDIFKDDKGWIWVGTWNGGFYLYLPSKSAKHSEGLFRKFIINKKEGAKHIWKIFQDSDGIYWIATHGGGIYAMQLPKNASNQQNEQNWEPNYKIFAHQIENETSISNNDIQDILEDNNRNIWVSTIHGLNIIKKEERKKLNWTDNKINSINFRRSYHKPGDKNVLSGNRLTKLCKDKQGLIWVGSSAGLSKFNWYKNQFEMYNILNTSNKTNDEFELINSLVLKDENTLILGSDINGVLTYDLEKEELLERKIFDIPDLNKQITSFHKYGAHILYIGTTAGVGKLNLATNKIEMYKFPKLPEWEEIETYTRFIFKDSKNRLWAGTEIGLVKIDEKRNSYEWYFHNHKDTLSISDNSITQIFEDANNNIWISTFNGLNLLQEEGKKYTFKTFKRNDIGVGDKICSNKITAIATYNNIIYFGSTNGIFYYNINTSKFEIIEEQKLNYSINNLQITDDGVIWAHTTDGILRYNLNTKETNIYGTEDGIGLSYRIHGICYDAKGNVFFGGNQGFVKINNAKLKRNNETPDVYITDAKTIKSSSKEAIKLNCLKQKSITLPSDNYYLSLGFTALNYSQPENNQYAYRLIGFGDEEWQYTKSQQAIYTNLDAGAYTFQVKAANNEGVWNEKGVQLQIKVQAAFVETFWFKLLLAGIAFAIYYVANFLHTKHIRDKNEFLNKHNERLNVQVKQTEAANLALAERERRMKVILDKLDESNKELSRSNEDLEQFAYIASHDLQEPLKTVKAFINLFNSKFNDKIDSRGKEYLSYIVGGVDRMSALIKSILTYSQVGKQDVEFKKTCLTKLVQAKIKDLSKIMEEKNASISCSPLPAIYCAGDQIAMVFHNLILNGIKFNKSSAPQIKITATEGDLFWEFHVKDNGIGIAKQYQDQIFEIFKRLHRKAEYEGTGIGLSLCNKIVHRHNGTIWVDSEIGNGTTFIFTISKKLNGFALQTNVRTSKIANSIPLEIK